MGPFCCQFSQFSCSVLSDSLWLHEPQHSRFPCPSPTPGACSNSCPSSQWCHPTISSSVVLFSSCLQSFPASGSFPRNWFFESDDQSIGVSASVSVLPMNTQDWFSLGLMVWFCCWRLQFGWLATLFGALCLAFTFYFSPASFSHSN